MLKRILLRIKGLFCKTKNDDVTELLNFESRGTYCKTIEPIKRTRFEIIKDHVFRFLRKLNLMEKEEYFVEYRFREKLNYTEYYLMYFIEGDDYGDCLRQHNNIVSFLIKNFLLISTPKPIKLSKGYNLKHYKTLYQTHRNSLNVIEVRTSNWVVDRFEEIYDLTVDDWFVEKHKGHVVDIRKKLSEKIIPVRVYNKTENIIDDKILLFEFIVGGIN